MTQAIEFVCPRCDRPVGRVEKGTDFWKAIYAMLNGGLSPEELTGPLMGHYCPKGRVDGVTWAKARLVRA